MIRVRLDSRAGLRALPLLLGSGRTVALRKPPEEENQGVLEDRSRRLLAAQRGLPAPAPRRRRRRCHHASLFGWVLPRGRRELRTEEVLLRDPDPCLCGLAEG